MEFEYAIVFHHPKSRTQEAERKAFQASESEIVSNLIQAGIQVTVLAGTEDNHEQYVICLLSAPLALLLREDQILTMERMVDFGSTEELGRGSSSSNSTSGNLMLWLWLFVIHV